MAHWILQANPTRYRLAEALASPGGIRHWTVAHHRAVIAPGDRIALWATGEPGGVQALGSVTEGPELVPDDDANWVNRAEGERPTWRIGVKITHVLPSPIPRAELAADPVFAEAAIIRMPGGGNPFPVTESQWQAIESRLASTATEDQNDAIQLDVDDAPRKSPGQSLLRWTREEAILALDLFVNGGVVNGGRFLGKGNPKVIALSQQLRSMPTHPGVARDARFRNPAGVELKLMNFRAVERDVKRELGIPGANELPGGMARYSALDRAIFEEYYSNEFHGLAADAQAIRLAAADAPEPLATVTAEDRPVEDASTASYEAAGAEGGVRSRSEHALVCRYADWLTASGIKVVSRLYRVPGLARPFLCDAFLPARNALIEAKSSDRRVAIRMAVGQLLDYKRLEGTNPRLAVLLPHETSADVWAFLDSLGIASIWPSGEGFRDSANGALTRT